MKQPDSVQKFFQLFFSETPKFISSATATIPKNQNCHFHTDTFILNLNGIVVDLEGKK